MAAGMRRRGHEDDFPVVALVGSAGAIEAASRVLHDLSPRIDAAVVVLIHSMPDGSGRGLAASFRRSSPLPVVEAADDRAFAPGEVVVVPPGKHLLATAAGRTCLIDSGQYPPSRPSADLLLVTLATAFGPRAVAVVLSGAGHDGATGATAVHACGGIVLATDERTSQTFSMPSAAISRDEAVDLVLPLGEVAGVLNEIAEPAPAV